MDSKHIERDFSAHRKSVIRPYDEFVKLEIFSFDPKHTKYYMGEDKSLVGLQNALQTSYRSWNCFKSEDKQNEMKFKIEYYPQEQGEYRIDFIYEQNSLIHEKIGKKNTNTNKDLTGSISINGVEEKPVPLFDGENNIIKRLPLFKHFTDEKQEITFTVPHNCYFYGVIIRKVITYVGDNYYGNRMKSQDGNLILTTCTVTYSDMVKPKELSAEIFYDDAIECDESPSGFYIDYHDECNFYLKNDENEEEQIFGGYVSSILPDADRTKLTIHCADRLVDGQNKYVLDLMRLGGGSNETTDTGYSKEMTHDFETYPSALKYLCDIHEVTLKSNISKNYTVDGEKYAKGFTITYGSSKKIKKIPSTNGITSVSKNHIMIRNKSDSRNAQTWTLYDASQNAKQPIEITNFPYLHITYGLGEKKTTSSTKTTEKVESSDGVGGTQKFTKCGVSQDGKYLMAIGLPSASKDNISGWTKAVFKRKCPHCGSDNMVWDIDYGEGGYAPCRGANEGGGYEGHIFCKSCDADYSCQGHEHYSWSSYKMELVSKIVSSSKSEKDKLRSGQMVAVPSTTLEVSSEDIIKSITKEAFKYRYVLGGGSSSYSSMKSSGFGDCWAFSELIFDMFKKHGVSCQIKEYRSTPSVGNHRSVIYKNAQNKWVDFPYREQGWGSRYNNMLNNYPIGASFHGRTVQEFKGNNIGNAKGVSSKTSTKTTNVTHTKGYDKDKPFQGYLKIVYSLSQSFKAKKYAVYVKFTQTPSSNFVSTGGMNLYWVNDTIKQATLRIGDDAENQHDGLIYFLRQAVHHNENARFYLQSIEMEAPAITHKQGDKDVDWYKLDNSTDDQSSCKLDLYQITFNDNSGVEPATKQSCGKTVNAMMQELVDDAGYYVSMSYGKHRKDDQINFRVVNNTKEKFVASEGDNNNILSWNSISYSPVGSLFNLSRCVFKTDDDQYYYIDSHDTKSIFQYGEQCTMTTNNDKISKEQAYFNATESDKFNPSQTYTYTITVPNYPNVRLGDLVKVVSNAKKLNSLKEVNSIKFTFEHDKMPRLRTEIGLGELAPDIQLKKNIRKLRNKAKEEDTLFSSTALPITEQTYYTWDR